MAAAVVGWSCANAVRGPLELNAAAEVDARSLVDIELAGEAVLRATGATGA